MNHPKGETMEFLGIGLTGSLHKKINSLNDACISLKNACISLKTENATLKKVSSDMELICKKNVEKNNAELEVQKKLFDRTIIVKCPFCDYSLPLDLSKIPEILDISAVFEEHVCSNHWILEPNVTEEDLISIHKSYADMQNCSRYSRQYVPEKARGAHSILRTCNQCNYNYNLLKRKEHDINILKADCAAMALELGWVWVGENVDTVAYTGYNSDESVFGIVHVKKIHVMDIPLKIERGKYVYSDGSAYPVSLIDFIHETTKKGRSVVSSEASNGAYTLSENESNILEYIRSNPDCKHIDIVNGTNIPKGSVSRGLTNLDENKLIHKNESGGFIVVQ